MDYSFEDFKHDKYLAAKELGTYLYHGALDIYLGAGASKGFGLPSWIELIARILGKGHDTDFIETLSKMGDQDLVNLLNDVDDQSDSYLEKVYNSLYQSVNVTEIDQRLAASPLLLAVASMITGRCRGRVKTVITYNYDDILEQYLKMLGYRVCSRKKHTEFSTWSDIEINHIHGYLPQSRSDESSPEDIILSGDSYRERRAAIDEGWSLYINHCMDSKIGLFIGLSGDDSSLIDILTRINKKQDEVKDCLGIWLLTPEAFKRNHKTLLKVNICPIEICKEDIPKFVFKIAQSAAEIAQS